jgi:hypothetical protein
MARRSQQKGCSELNGSSWFSGPPLVSWETRHQLMTGTWLVLVAAEIPLKLFWSVVDQEPVDP